MIFTGLALARPADEVDLSSATTAKRTGPASWVEEGLEIPFDRALTDAEVADVRRLLTSPTNTAAANRKALEDYLALPSVTTAQNTAAVRALSRLVLDLLDK